MIPSSFLELYPDSRERTYGLRYFVFQTAFLSSLLALLNSLLPVRMPVSLLNAVFFTVNFACVAFIFRRYLKASLGQLFSMIPRTLLVAAAGFAVYWTATALVNLGITAIAPDFFNVNDQTIVEMSREHPLLIAFCTVVLVPVTEECLHRGLIFRSLYRRSPAAAYLISTAVFSAVHIFSYIGYADGFTLLLCFLQYVPAGLCLAAAYQFGGTVFCPILIHCAVNALGILATR